ncbi:GerAB/ArcD/ProY family transporter [Sutcliffiella horikoshii]|uniref:GerAB/ArcD/ProY family transporter n=1 Tax=Sutcliffiella horikoshii TaxID=79883 RepID=A0A5D4T161_9BACI|nr:GerAB/ArcD/ProY family transporter [Sutcliffiella horikoshii]TYS69430.1 GerAB/ArcD/ProY family transporter [Sutcliffiella horikoshii]
MWKSGFRWMFLILGTVIGAGYASGRELWQFFGSESGLAILLFTLFFIISCYVILQISSKEQTEHFSPVLRKLVGPRASYLYNIVMVVYLFTTTVVMLAGGGAALQVFSIPYWGGIAIICTLLIVLFVYDVKGMVTVNVVIIPIIVLTLAYVLIDAVLNSPDVIPTSVLKQSNWPAGFTFTALNILPLVAVLSAIGKEVKGKGEIIIASVGSGVILGVISLFYNQTLILVQSKLGLFEIPLFAIIQSYPFYMLFFMTILLWVAIYTTAASGLLGLVTRFRNVVPIPLWLMCLLFILLMVPFTAVGFSVLVAILYPLFGLINLYLLVCILLYPIKNRESS